MTDEKNVIYALRANQLITEALSEVENKMQWKPCCILAERDNLDYVNKHYDDCLIIDNRKAHLDLNDQFRDLKSFYDETIRQRYGKYETEVCKNLERILPSLDYSHHDRLFFFHVWLSFWLEQITTLQPDLVLFVNSPMLPHHFVLYLVSVEEKIDLLLGNNISHPRRLTNFKRRIEELPLGLEECFLRKKVEFEKKGNGVISKWATEYYEKNQEYKTPDYLAVKQKKENRKGILSLLFIKEKGKFLQAVSGVVPYMFYGYNVVLKRHHKVAEYLCERHKARLAHHYIDLCSKNPALDQKFIYFPLHYQPERSTSPDAGIFADQHLIAKTLDRAIPSDWKIYIKEHPSQFATYNEGEKGREVADYREMARLKSVVFVPTDFPSEKLINNAEAVVTCTGTAGWEAVLRGIPVLIFAAIWYDLCRGVFRVRSVSEVKNAIRLISQGEKPDGIQAKLLIDAVNQVSCPLWKTDSGDFNRKGFIECLLNANKK